MMRNERQNRERRKKRGEKRNEGKIWTNEIRSKKKKWWQKRGEHRKMKRRTLNGMYWMALFGKNITAPIWWLAALQRHWTTENLARK